TTCTNAATSCRVTRSTSATRSASNDAFIRISRASASGTTPSPARASATRISISSQCPNRASSDQTAAISGRTYRGIMARAGGCGPAPQPEPPRQVVLEPPQPLLHVGVGDPDDLGGQDRRV